MPTWLFFATPAQINYAFMAQPFFELSANQYLDPTALDFAFMAQPFVPYGVMRL